jgi:uncharacterized protein YoxC
MQIRRCSLALTVAVLVLGGCSSDASSSTSAGASTSATSSGATTSANDFMAGFCGALTDWSDAIRQRQGSFTPDTDDIESLKQSWLDFLDGVNEDTDAMLAKLHDLGTPDVPNGEETVTKVIDALETLGASFQDLRDRSADLPTTSSAAFTQQFGTLLTSFQNDVSSFGDSFDKLQSDELESAFSAAPACAPLQ